MKSFFARYKSDFIIWFIIFSVVLFTYRNVYDNEFHFDDAHTIQNNYYITDIHNLPKFFGKEGSKMFSSVESNQVYRPLVTSQVAVSYWLSMNLTKDKNGFDTFYYRIIIMLEFLLLLVLMYFFLKKIFGFVEDKKTVKYLSYLGVLLFGVHTVNAETINYIISLSDLVSTLWVLAAFVVYMYFPKLRKIGLYLIPFFLAILTKQTSVVFLPMLVVYILFYESNIFDKNSGFRSKISGLKKYGFDIVFTTSLTAFGTYLVFAMQSDSYNPGGSSRFLYMLTEPLVLFHYFVSYFIPYNLSADTDWHLVSGLNDWRVYVGGIFVISLLFLAFKCWKNKKLIPVSFGILWFFITLAPTSSIIPLAEVMNDHRMFFPFIGITAGFIWILYFLFEKYKEILLATYLRKNLFVIGVSLIFLGHIYGTSVRTEVWDNGHDLWYDVTQKSPENGRGIMNYGLRLMNEGQLDSALTTFDMALKYAPYYSYLHTNRGIVLKQLGRIEEAEASYKKALDCNFAQGNTYYYYGIFLRELKRNREAIQVFESAKSFSPENIYARYALMELYSIEFEWQKLSDLCDETLRYFPNDKTTSIYKEQCKGKKSKIETLEEQVANDPSTNNYINLSLAYYNEGLFDKMIDACQTVIKKEPKNIIAYNNLISAYNGKGDFESAIKIGEIALKIDPNNQLLKNNIKLAIDNKDLKSTDFSKKTVDELINISLTCYYQKMYIECILACKEAVKKAPNNAIAWNNMCSAYNALGEWDKAIDAGNKAIKIDPKFQLAINNVALAKKQKAKK